MINTSFCDISVFITWNSYELFSLRQITVTISFFSMTRNTVNGIHFFSFLEASVAEGRTASFIAKQFVRDGLNTFAFILRTFILMVRLNVYDMVDDFLDSYYIFLGDFDDDEYFIDLFFSQ